MRKIRLFTEADLSFGAKVVLTAQQAHYLKNVLRQSAGSSLHLFNGRDGEWRGTITAVDRGKASAEIAEQERPQDAVPDLWLMFAPVKRARIDFIAEKATELGVSAIAPVVTDNTAVARVNEERLRANAIEAAEQCGRLSVPEVQPVAPLAERLGAWPGGRRILMCDESGGGAPVMETLEALDPASAAAPWAVLCGPEGGFSNSELDLLGKSPIVTRVGLGPRILRADTAVIAALASWQAVLGDWRLK